MALKRILNILLTAALCIVCGVFAYLCLSYYKEGFIGRNVILFTVLSSCVFFGAGVTAVVFLFKTAKNPTYETIYKTILSGFFLVGVVLVIFFIMQKTGFLELVQDAERYKEYLQTSGRWMPVVYVVLQYFQVILLPIPTFVSTLAGVALFGPFKALLYSSIGVVLGSYTGFFIGRCLGEKAVAWIVGKETLYKWQEKVKGKDNLFLTAMFFLPIFPDDVLCFVAGLSSMPTKYFLVMILISRLIGLSTTCFAFGFIPFDTWWGLLIWGIIAAVIIAAFVLLYKNVDKINVWMEKTFGSRKRKDDKKNRE